MNIFKIAGKFLDQPILVAKFEKRVPVLLAAGGGICTIHDIRKAETKDKKKKAAIKTGMTVAFTVVSALAAPKMANKIFKNSSKSLEQIKAANTVAVDSYLKSVKPDTTTAKLLEKAKSNILSFHEVKKLYNSPIKDETVLNKLIPEPENITSKEIFSEIGRLSFLGFVPVVGGILGGISGDKLSGNKWKKNLPDKIKEGAYQYLANIFLCNVGAGAALALMEKSNVKAKSTRAFGMIGGIVTTGIVGGSAIANVISNKIINPIFGSSSKKGLYEERKPEALDIGLHVDDIATVAVMSGLKWIEPALPIMYSISGFRAGIGYRNVNKCNKNNTH